MAETRGYETINDRAGTKGGTWGHTDGDAPTADPAKQVPRDATANPADRTTATGRWTRQLKARKSFAQASNPSIDDRGNTTQENLDAAASYKNGVFVNEAGAAEAGSGANTAVTHTDPENTVYARAAHDGAAAILDDSTAAKIAEAKRKSLIDRTDGWGHSDVPASRAAKQGDASSYTAATAEWADATITQTALDTNRDDD